MQVSKILAIKGSALYTIAPSASVAEAIAVMVEQDIGSLVCFEAGRMVGMLTFRELLKTVHALGPTAGGTPIASVMLHEPVRVDADMEMDELRRLMLRNHARYLPVMDGDTLLGVVSFHDVARAVLEEQGFENRQLKNYIRGHPNEEALHEVSP